MGKKQSGHYVAFWVIDAADLEELRRVSRRLCYPTLQPLCVELVRLGLAVLEDRYEPHSRSGRFQMLRAKLAAPRRERRQA
jgi:hypothetical protein